MRQLISDDGRSATLDLHGQHVDEAERLIRRTVRLAAERGRSSVRVVHGSSTSNQLARNRTIKHRLEDLLEHGDLGVVSTYFSTGDATIIGLPLGRPLDTRRIVPADIQ